MRDGLWDVMDAYRRLLPPRIERSNKGTYGTLLLGAGSYGMGGAAVLAAKAAYRSGAGLVAVLSQACNRTIIQSSVPEAVYTEYSLQEAPFGEAEPLQGIKKRVSALALGPGLGVSPQTARAMMAALEAVYGARRSSAAESAAAEGRRAGKGPSEGRKVPPLVLDADALNMVAAGLLDYDAIRSLAGTDCRVPLLITPHPGEMSRLTGLSVSAIMEDPAKAAAAYAKRHDLVCVLKDHRTVITDGRRIFLNPTGCDGMATGGSGDVLTGLIGGLLAQGCGAMEAAGLGTFLHGLAGELAQAALGARSVMAGDIVTYLPEALRSLEKVGCADRSAGLRAGNEG